MQNNPCLANFWFIPNEVTRTFDEGMQAEIFYQGFGKAFGSVNNHLLLIESFGIQKHFT